MRSGCILEQVPQQIVFSQRDRDFPWFPGTGGLPRHPQGETALVDLAGLRDAIAEQGVAIPPR